MNRRRPGQTDLEKTVSVVIPNYNGIRYIRGCLDAMRAQTLVPGIIVVDNASADESDRIVENEYPEARLIRMETNTGFTGAVNEGIRQSEGSRYVILLNNDTEADPRFVEELVAGMEADPGAFSAQAKMLSMADPSVLDDAGDLYCALGWAFGRGKGKPDAPRYDRPCRIFSACAGAAIYRMSALEEVGGFDDAHFAYLEDLDIGWRARTFGYHNLYLPGAVVRHAGSAVSGSRHNEFKVSLSSRNSVYVIGKNMPPVQRILNAPLLLLGFWIKSVYFSRKGLGDAYRKGLREGRSLAKAAKERRRETVRGRKRFGAYLRIQAELWTNCFRRALG